MLQEEFGPKRIFANAVSKALARSCTRIGIQPSFVLALGEGAESAGQAQTSVTFAAR